MGGEWEKSKTMFYGHSGDITDTGNKSGAGSDGEENEFSLGHVVLELPDTCY